MGETSVEINLYEDPNNLIGFNVVVCFFLDYLKIYF